MQFIRYRLSGVVSMYFIYSILLSLGFLLMLPLFILRREKYASGFRQRLGNYPEFKQDGRDLIWLHCVSVGETNAAQPLVEALRKEFPDHRLVISTTTRTGQELARKIFAGKADAIVYFPFDFKFSVRRALDHFKPSLVLLMETEIWPRFIHEAKSSGAKIAIVNGRLSQRSFERYSRVRSFVARVLADVDLALMQNETDAKRIVGLGLDGEKIVVTGNLKFDIAPTSEESKTTEYFRQRFGIDGMLPLVLLASTHDPEERWILDSIEGDPGESIRLMIAPRHPERFDSVFELAKSRTNKSARRSGADQDGDRDADIIILDSIGELRAAYPLADIVFVGGSLIPHGGQSVLEPAAAGKAILTGFHTENFADAVASLRDINALVQLPELREQEIDSPLSSAFSRLVEDPTLREELGRNAAAVMEANRGATDRTVVLLKTLVDNSGIRLSALPP